MLKCILLDLYVRVFLEPNIHGYIVYMFVYTCILDIWVRVYMSHDLTKLTKWLCAQRRLRSTDQSLRCLHEEADAQAELSLRWAHTHCVSFVMSWLICTY